MSADRRGRTIAVLRPGIGPDVDARGVPNCSERCPKHDGKRCRVMGLRAGGVCEPAVEDMAESIGGTP